MQTKTKRPKRISRKRQLEYLLRAIETCQMRPGRAEFRKVYDELLKSFDDTTVATIITMGIRKRKIHHTLDNMLTVVAVPL